MVDVESTDHDSEQREQSELDPFIQHVVKVPSKQEANVARAQFLALCWAMFVMGWTNSSTGPLLPRIQIFYDVGLGAASWVFVSLRTGEVMGALFNLPMTERLGFGKMLVVGALIQNIAFFLEFLALPFPAFALSFTLAGMGTVFQSASAYGFIATLQSGSDYKQGYIQAAYGIGALSAPLSATHFAQLATYWSRHYLVSLSLAVTNIVILASVFKFQPQDVCLRQAGEILPDKTPGEEIQENKFAQLMKNKNVHLFAVFLMVYSGIEITIGGWIVTFLVLIRGGGPSSGYVETGFFGGITLGRVVLTGVTKKIGPINAIYIYTLIAIFLQLILWLVPSFTAAAISVTLMGVILGPIFPTTLNHTARVLPRHLVNGTVGWISACIAGGSTVLSYITGEMASKFGIKSLQPSLFVMMIILGTLWVFVPKKSTFIS